jgi:hypothetical protein
MFATFRALVIVVCLTTAPFATAKSDKQTAYEEKYAPLLKDQSAAMRYVQDLISKLPSHEKSVITPRFAIFAIQDTTTQGNCQNFFSPAFTTPLPGRHDSILMLCRQYFLTMLQSVSTEFIVALSSKGQPAELERRMERGLSEYGDFAILDYNFSDHPTSFAMECWPAYRAYYIVNNRPTRECYNFQGDPAVVREDMWRRIQSAVQGYGPATPPAEDSHYYWSFTDDLQKHIFTVLFDMVVLHELGHIYNDDPWSDSADAEDETNADEFAMRMLKHLHPDIEDQTILSTASLYAVLHTLAVQISWDESSTKVDLPRLDRRNKAIICSLKAFLADPAKAEAEKNMVSAAFSKDQIVTFKKLHCR